MSAETFNIKIRGYWIDKHKSVVPNHSGIYFVYECTYNKEIHTVTIHKLIYIGGADDVYKRINGHEKYEDWKKHVQEGNTLCYSTGPVQETDRRRAEAAYIFRHKPPENDEYRDIFPFDQTTINSSGVTDLLDPSFTIYKS